MARSRFLTAHAPSWLPHDGTGWLGTTGGRVISYQVIDAPRGKSFGAPAGLVITVASLPEGTTVAGMFLLNTILAVALQVRASRGAHTVAGAATALRRAGVLLLAACLIFASTAMFGAVADAVVLGVAVAVLTLGELLQSAGAWGLSYELAPDDREGEYLGAFAMGSRIYDAAGPVVVTSLILGLGGPGWLLLGLLFLALGVGLTPAARWADRPGDQS